MADIIQIRRDTAANWTAVNPILAQGEFGVETDTLKLKIGDGTSPWTGLRYYHSGSPYEAGEGISINGFTISNTGIVTIGTGGANGTIKANGQDITVKGLGSAAYTSSSDYATSAQGGKADTAVQPSALATVATSGSYTDLSNKPTIPTVNNATLTIQKNGITVDTFTANASSNVTANITVPTKISDLTNDSNFANIDLSNLTATGKATTAHLPMPSGSYDTLTLGASESTYTAPADGYFVLQGRATSTGNFRITLFNMNTYVSSGFAIPSPSITNTQYVFIPANAEDVVEVIHNNFTVSVFRFVYANGAA